MSIHAMSDDEFEEFERDDEVTQWDEELSCSVESRDEWIESGLLHLLEPSDDPDDEDNYDDTCELDDFCDEPEFEDDFEASDDF